MLLAANIFQPLIDVFETVLKFFHNSIGVPWGWSIVLLTIAVRACLLPLTVKQFGSMQRMQQLAPELKAIQAKYKEDKQRQQQEVMAFYKENNVNPLGSCLPLAAQIPVFISLFYMLRQSLRQDICPAVQQAALAAGRIHHGQTVACGTGKGAAAHSAHFLFVGDLTSTATGATLVVLIVLYVGSQLLSTVMMSSATTDAMQRRIMMVIPLFFVFIAINFPAGVLVYWITTNLWTILQQYVIKRRMGPMKPAVALAGAGGATAVADSPRRSVVDSNGSGKAGASSPAAAAGERLGALLRGRGKPAEETTAVVTRSGPPPRPPRKKKKRSGRRR